MQTARWSNGFAYVSFDNNQIIKYDAKNFLEVGSVLTNQKISSLFVYGQEHLIGLGYLYQSVPPIRYETHAILIHSSDCELYRKLEYRIVPADDNILVEGIVSEMGVQLLNIDYTKRMVLIPVRSYED